MPPTSDLKPEETKLFVIYVHELWWLANSIQRKTTSVFEKAKVPQEGFYMQVDPELHSLIASTLSDAANLKKLLVTPNVRLNGEYGRQFRLRRNRALSLRKLLEGVPLVELLNAKVRNTLEHFDEYLDEANLSISEAKTPPSPMAVYNMVFSHWEVTKPRVYPIRLYVSSERKFYNMKWSVDLGAMNREAAAVVERLAQFVGAAADGPGGLMLRIG